MKKTINVEVTYAGMRIDRFLRKQYESIPQSLIEKSLRGGKIKLNKKKVKSSIKLQINDLIELHNFEIKKKIITNKIKFKPSDTIIRENEDFIIENNDNFIVLNKQAGISVQGGTKSKKNLIDIFSNSEIFKDEKPYSVHRLDKETSGVFLIAKNRPTAQLLTTLFRLRKVYKTIQPIDPEPPEYQITDGVADTDINFGGDGDQPPFVNGSLNSDYWEYERDTKLLLAEDFF